MPREAKRTVHRAAGVILTDPEGRVLLQLRDDDDRILYPNHWGITGGNARAREKPENTARREVREETGLELDEFYPFTVTDVTLDSGVQNITHYYYAKTDKTVDDMVLGEGQELRFFCPEALKDLPLAFEHYEVLTDFIASPEYQSCLSKEDDVVAGFHRALSDGDDWFPALLEAVRRWQLPEEVVNGRRYRYLIGGEAFDWLLLAERLCESVNGAVPADERERLLFFARPPQDLPADEFKQAIGDAKHRAHLNFMYGVIVEEALQLTVEEEVLKERRTRVLSQRESVQQEVFHRIYRQDDMELLAVFREEHGQPSADELSYGALREFTYWLFKRRVNDSDPARVASDTRKALAKVSELEMAARRRARRATQQETNAAVVIDGEVVARQR